MNINDNELRDLLAQLDLSEVQARAIIKDLQQGDDLIRRHDQIPVDPAVLDRTEAQVLQAPAPAERRLTQAIRPPDKELRDLLTHIDLNPEQIGVAVEEIQQSDDLIRRLDRIKVDPAVLDRTEDRIRQAPARSGFKRINYGGLLPALTLAASLIIALGLITYLTPPKNGGPFPDYDTSAYWQQVLMQKNDLEQDINDMVLSEVLKCWSEVEWKADDILGVEIDSPPNPIDVSKNGWTGPWLCE